MRNEVIELPSNRKFGSFFSFVFAVVTIFFLTGNQYTYSSIFGALMIVTLFTTIISPNLLLPFNKLWMRLGLLIGLIISPLVLSFIFFLILSPISLLTRIFGRDELRLKNKDTKSFWIKPSIEKSSWSGLFDNQF